MRLKDPTIHVSSRPGRKIQRLQRAGVATEKACPIR